MSGSSTIPYLSAPSCYDDDSFIMLQNDPTISYCSQLTCMESSCPQYWDLYYANGMQAVPQCEGQFHGREIADICISTCGGCTTCGPYSRMSDAPYESRRLVGESSGFPRRLPHEESGEPFASRVDWQFADLGKRPSSGMALLNASESESLYP